MLKQEICILLEQTLKTAQEQGKIPRITLPEINVEHPKNKSRGDYASNLPIRLARDTGVKPLELAKIIAELIPRGDMLQKVEVAPPGFINFIISDKWLTGQVDAILKHGTEYGCPNIGQGRKIQVEFVSANPTGPLHVGHGRGAVLGSTLANALSVCGYTVEKEYYINDAGTQMQAFYESLYARYLELFGKEAQIPENGYHGSYMVDLAKEIYAERGEEFLKLTPEEAVIILGSLGKEKVISSIRNDLNLLKVSFDVWFSEKSLYQNGQYQKVMAILEQKGAILKKEGAIWFSSPDNKEDKDNVLVRSTGVPTYFASDCAYHYNKFVERGFDNVINIWGADHHGHIPRLKNVLSILDINPDRLHVMTTQMVTLIRNGIEVKLSKRSGEMITLREIIDEVGADACRFFFLSRASSSQMDFDLELAKQQSMDNPVYYIQYAYARIASIFRMAAENNIDYHDGNISLLTTEPELTLIKRMIQLPEILELVTRNIEPHHLPHYAQELATAFHSFYKQCRVISEEDKNLTMARLKLVEAARIILAKTLDIMGISSPEKM